MRSALSALVLVVVAAAGCGTVGASDAPPETIALTSLAPVTTTTTPGTSAPVTTTTVDPNVTGSTRVPVPPSTTTPPLPTTTLPPEPPTFEYAIHPMTEETVSLTWNEDCPLHWEELSLLSLKYWNFEGRPVMGRMVTNTSVVEDVIVVFERLFDMRFPIERLALVDDYGGDDKAAMRANVTASFNCRYVDGTESWSNHAFGLAIDINPLINPWAREGNVLPLEGTTYALNRTNPIPGMINEGDRVISVFEQVGWSWGGVWASADYMHFSKPGN